MIKCPYCRKSLNPNKIGQHFLKLHEEQLLKKTKKITINGLTVEIFERTYIDNETLESLEQLISSSILKMTGLKNITDSIGFFICGSDFYKMNEKFLRDYLNFPKLNIDNGAYTSMMCSFLFNRKAVVSIKLEHYLNAPAVESHRNILHELSHLLCDNQLGRAVTHSGYISAYLPPKVANHVKNTLNNIYEDYRADSFLVNICPDILIGYFVCIAKETENEFEKKQIDGFIDKAKVIESTLRAFWCKQNLFILHKLPKEYKEKNEFKLAHNLFTERIKLLKTYISIVKGRKAQFESLIETDFSNQLKLDLRFCQIVGFPKALKK